MGSPDEGTRATSWAPLSWRGGSPLLDQERHSSRGGLLAWRLAAVAVQWFLLTGLVTVTVLCVVRLQRLEDRVSLLEQKLLALDGVAAPGGGAAAASPAAQQVGAGFGSSRATALEEHHRQLLLVKARRQPRRDGRSEALFNLVSALFCGFRS